MAGAATLEAIGPAPLDSQLFQTQLKVKASLVRTQHQVPSNTSAFLSDSPACRIHLRGRRGLEQIVKGGKWTIISPNTGNFG